VRPGIIENSVVKTTGLVEEIGHPVRWNRDTANTHTRKFALTKYTY